MSESASPGTASASPTAKTVFGGLADFLVSELESDSVKTAIETEIAKGEANVTSLVASALKSAPKPGGIFGLIVPEIDSALESYASKLVAQYGPNVLYAFIDLEAHAFAKSLGG